MNKRSKKLVFAALAISVLVGCVYVVRFFPLLAIDNTGAEKVVLLHGLGRSESAMLPLEVALTKAGFDVHSIGYPSTDQPPDVLLDTVAKEVLMCCEESDATTHFVGHSLGGLLIRAYLSERQPLNLGRVVLLGTPNKGSELADLNPEELLPNALREMAGPTAISLNTGPEGFPASLPPPAYPVGVIAGTKDSRTTNRWLPLPNDGMVSVESAQLDGMADFIQFDVSHWELRGRPEIAAQVVGFLVHGQFDDSGAAKNASE